MGVCVSVRDRWVNGWMVDGGWVDDGWIIVSSKQ